MSQRRPKPEITVLAEAYGFELVRYKRHPIFRHPNGAIVTAMSSASDHRSMRNLERDFRRCASA